MARQITLIPGDGIGPEVADATIRAVEATGVALEWERVEAGAKALGTGISHGISWLELEVTREPTGRPLLQLSGRAAGRARSLGVTRISLSLTHSRDTALAVVMMES